MNGFLVYGSGALSLLNLLYFAWKILSGAVAPTNTASWAMWMALDIAVLATTISAKRPYVLALSYVIGVGAIFLAHLKMGVWEWGWVETVSAIGVAVSMILWWKLSADHGTIVAVHAMNIAGIPLMVALWVHPDPHTFWLFANTAIACAGILIGEWPWTMKKSFLAWSGFVYNAAMALIVLR